MSEKSITKIVLQSILNYLVYIDRNNWLFMGMKFIFPVIVGTAFGLAVHGDIVPGIVLLLLSVLCTPMYVPYVDVLTERCLQAYALMWLGTALGTVTAVIAAMAVFEGGNVVLAMVGTLVLSIVSLLLGSFQLGNERRELVAILAKSIAEKTNNNGDQ